MDPPPPPVPVEEVHVQGEHGDAGGERLRAGEVRQIPGAFGDAFRAVEALPGVTPVASGLPFFFVRGAPPGNTGYYLDGVRVPLLFHLGLGPSVIQPALVDHVDFYPGGFPARFGRFAGGVLSADTRAPEPRAHGEGNVRLFDSGALVEAPIDGGRGSVLVGGRYSYTGAIFSLLAPDTRLSYWDYQARATWALTDRDRLGVFVFGSDDALSSRDDSGAPFHQVLATQFHRVDLRWDRALGSTGRMRLALTLGYDQSGDDATDVKDALAGLRLEAEGDVAEGARLRGGADVMLDHYDLSHFNDAATLPAVVDALYPARNDAASGGWVDLVWRVSPRVEITPGLRADVFTSRRVHAPVPATDPFGQFVQRIAPPTGAAAVPALDPRLATRVHLDPRVTLVSTAGVSHQPPSFFLAVPGLAPAGLATGLQTAYELGQSVEVALPADFTATTTAFFHDYTGLTDLTATCADYSSSGVQNQLCVADRVRGKTYGVELLVRRSLTRKITGWLAYTLSRSTREAHPIPGEPHASADVVSEFDRPHVLNLVGAVDLGRMWRAGARFFFYSGRPYSPESMGVPVPPLDSQRLAPFWRLDLRLEKRWVLAPTRYVSFVAEWMNATLNREEVDVECTSSLFSVLDTCRPRVIGPVSIPSVGVEGAF